MLMLDSLFMLGINLCINKKVVRTCEHLFAAASAAARAIWMLRVSLVANARHLVERHFMSIKCNYDTRAHRINGKWKWILRVIIVQPLWSFNAAGLLGLHTIKYHFRNESGHNVAANAYTPLPLQSIALHRDGISRTLPVLHAANATFSCCFRVGSWWRRCVSHSCFHFNFHLF